MFLPNPESGRVFGLTRLFTKLLKFATTRLSRKGCHKPDECALDVVNECLFVEPHRREEAKKPRRIKMLDEETILVDFPGAINQQSVLYEHLKYKLLEKQSRCKDCKWKNCQRDIADGFLDNEEDGRRGGVEPISDAASPLEIASDGDLIERYLGGIDDPQQREDFKSVVVDGYTKEEVARMREKKASNIRKQYQRNKAKAADFIKRTFFKKKNE